MLPRTILHIYTKQRIVEKGTLGTVSDQTFDSLHAHYLNTSIPETKGNEIEEVLESVADNFAAWTSSLDIKNSLQQRQSGYYCNNQNQHCSFTSDLQKDKDYTKINL